MGEGWPKTGFIWHGKCTSGGVLVKHGNEPEGSIKCSKILGYLSTDHLLKDRTPANPLSDKFDAARDFACEKDTAVTGTN